MIEELEVNADGRKVLYWALKFTDDALSKRAWEEAMRRVHGQHIWRTAVPVKDPVFWTVIAMGETGHREVMELMLEAARAVGDSEDTTLEHSFAVALCMRRDRLILNRSLVGDFGKRVFDHGPTGARLDSAGRMSPHDPDAAA